MSNTLLNCPIVPCLRCLLYHFDWFGHHMLQGLWSWPNSVTCLHHNPYGWWLLVDPKNGQKRLLFMGVGHMQHFFYLFIKEDTDWSMRNILEVQMPRYSKIMLGNCCNIWSSLLSSIMSCHQWVIRFPDWLNHFSFTIKLFSPTLPLHALLASPSVSHGQPNFRQCPNTNIGCCWNFVHLVTGHPRLNQPKWYNG